MDSTLTIWTPGGLQLIRRYIPHQLCGVQILEFLWTSSKSPLVPHEFHMSSFRLQKIVAVVPDRFQRIPHEFHIESMWTLNGTWLSVKHLQVMRAGVSAFFHVGNDSTRSMEWLVREIHL